MKKIINYLKQPKKIIIYLMNKNFFFWMNDKTYLKLKYRLILNKKLDLNNPKTFNEKLQWLKLYNRNPEYTKMVDKYEAKKYVASIIGNEYIIKTLEIYNNYNEIDFNKLPNQFVIKPTHTSGDIFICKDKKSINNKELRKKINRWLKRKYYYFHREWPYKNVKPRIIIEEYKNSKEQAELTDYKFFCFNGNAEMILVCSNRSKKLKKTWFDINWNMLDLREGDCKIDLTVKKPVNLSLMLEMANKLSQEIPFVRIDFYEIDGKVYFGEITFFPKAGYEEFKPEKYQKILGDKIKLP